MWCHQAAPRSTPIQRRALVVTDVLTRNAVLRVDRDADWVFRELHDPKTLPSRVRMAMVVSSLDAGAVLHMSFRMTIERTLLSRGLVDVIVGDLLGRTVQKMKARLESRPISNSGTAA